MTLSAKTVLLRRIRQMKKGDDTHAVFDEERHILPVPGSAIPGEAVIQIQTDDTDAYGSPIGTGPVIWDSKSRMPVAFSNSFQCTGGCGLHLGLVHAKKLDQDPTSLPPELDSVNMLGKASAHAKTGICKECWEKGKWKRVWKAVVKFILGPLLPEEPETKPAPPPVVVVFAAQPQHPPTNTAPVHPMNIPSVPPTGKPSSGAGPFSSIPILILAASIHLVSPIVVHATPIFHPVTMSSGDTAMRQSTPSPQEVVAALLQQARLLGLNDPTISVRGAQCCQRIERDATMGLIDPSTFQELANLVQRAGTVLQPQLYRAVFPVVPPPDRMLAGDFPAFRLLDSTPMFMSFTETPEQLRIIGRSGASKSTAAYAVLDAAVAKGHPCITIDSKGRGDFDILCRKHPGRVLKAVVGAHVFFNPWQYWRKMTDFFLRIFSRKDSQVVLDSSIELNVKALALSGGFAPTHRAIIDRIPDIAAKPGFPGIRADLKQSMLVPLQGEIEKSALFASIRCQRGWDLGEIVRKGFSLIIDTSQIAGTRVEEWLVVSLLVGLREEVAADPGLASNRSSVCMVYVDEATPYTYAQRDLQQLPSLVHLSTLTRGSNISLFLCYHSPKQIHAVLHSAYFMIIAALSNGDDIDTVRRACFLSPEQAKALSSLPKGVAVMRMADRYTEPFIITYPKIPDCPRLTPAEIDANNAPILARLAPVLPENFRRVVRPTPPPAAPSSAPLPTASVHPAAPGTTPGSAGPTPSAPPSTTAHSPTRSTPASSPCPPSPTSASTVTSLSQADCIYLLADIWNPSRAFLNLTQRANSLLLPSGTRMDFRALKAILRDLERLGLCQSVSVQMGSGGPSMMTFLTGQGHAFIASPYKPARAGTGYLHDFAQRLVVHLLGQKRIAGTIEARAMGSTKQVDVGFNCPVTAMDVAVECAISTFDLEPRQAARDLAEGWHRVMVFALNVPDLRKVHAAFAASGTDTRVTAFLPRDIKAASSMSEIYGNPAMVAGA